MAYTITRDNLVALVRNRGELRDAFSAAELVTYVNDSLAELWDLVAQKDPARLPLTQGNVTVVAGTDSYTLPSNCLAVYAVAVLDSSGANGYRNLERFSYLEKYEQGASGNDALTARYDIRGGKIWFSPTPAWSGTVRCEYVAHFVELSGGSSTFETYNAWTEYAVISSLIKAFAKHGKHEAVAVQMQLLEQCAKRIGVAAVADRSRAKRRRDVLPAPMWYRSARARGT